MLRLALRTHAIPVECGFAGCSGHRLLDNGGKDARQANNGSWGGWFGAGGVQGSSPGGLSPSRTSELRKTIKAAVAFGLPKGGGSGKSPGPGSPSGSERLDGSQTGPGKGTYGEASGFAYILLYAM